MERESLSEAERVARVVAVVDDDPLVLRTTGRALRALGHRAVLFDDPRAAASLLPTSTVDAVVLDLDMPWMDGAELARRLRESPARRGTPLLLLSGRPERLAAEDRGLFDAIHRKPMGLSELEHALAAVLGTRGESTPRLRSQSRLGGRRPPCAGAERLGG
jgi:DNA-binding response OmpR family regulator